MSIIFKYYIKKPFSREEKGWDEVTYVTFLNLLLSAIHGGEGAV